METVLSPSPLARARLADLGEQVVAPLAAPPNQAFVPALESAAGLPVFSATAKSEKQGLVDLASGIGRI
jgi:hypothetical protein